MSHKILVTGALGALGSVVTRSLRDVYGASHVMASDIHFPSPSHSADGPYERVNILSPVHMMSVLQEHHITYVFHLAGVHPTDASLNPMLGWELETKGLLNILQCALDCRVSRIFWPSTFDAEDPCTVNGIAKLAGEQWCRYFSHKHHLDVRSFRLPVGVPLQQLADAILHSMGVSALIV